MENHSLPAGGAFTMAAHTAADFETCSTHIYSMNSHLMFLAILVFQSPHLRPPEIIIKYLLYHLRLYGPVNVPNFSKCHCFSLIEILFHRN